MRASAYCSSGVYKDDRGRELGRGGRDSERVSSSSSPSSSSSSVADAESGVAGEDADWRAGMGKSPGASSGFGMGMKPVLETSLWNRWPISDPSQWDEGVR